MRRTYLVIIILVVSLLLAACQPLFQAPPPSTSPSEATAPTEAAATATADRSLPTPTEAPAPTAVAEPTATPATTITQEASPPPPIIELTWQWQRFDDSAGANDIDVPNPADYTIRFASDGSVSIQADCNQVTGAYEVSDSSLTIQLGPSTEVFCGDQSLDQQYLALLSDVASYSSQEAELVLNLQEDGGSMVFGLAPSVRGPEVAGLAIAPEDLRLDTQGLPYTWEAVIVPATPYDDTAPPGPSGMPEHLQIRFGATEPEVVQPGDPVMYIVPAAAYAVQWLENANPTVPDRLVQIDGVSYTLPAPAPTAGYPALPMEAVGAGYNDLAVQVGRIPATATSATKSGYRLVGRWMQDPNPVTNQALRYVYQGYTNDAKYLVSFWYPVSTSDLPDTADELSAEQQEAIQADPAGAIAAEADRLNALSADDWEPSLEQLDGLVASLEIEGMAANALEGRDWLWAASRSGGQDTQVAEPDKYRLRFTSDGTIDVMADCIALAGNYAADGGQHGALQWELAEVPSTDCGQDSLSSQFLSYLPTIQEFRVWVAGNILELPLPDNGPVLIFGNATPD